MSHPLNFNQMHFTQHQQVFRNDGNQHHHGDTSWDPNRMATHPHSNPYHEYAQLQPQMQGYFVQSGSPVFNGAPPNGQFVPQQQIVMQQHPVTLIRQQQQFVPNNQSPPMTVFVAPSGNSSPPMTIVAQHPQQIQYMDQHQHQQSSQQPQHHSQHSQQQSSERQRRKSRASTEDSTAPFPNNTSVMYISTDNENFPAITPARCPVTIGRAPGPNGIKTDPNDGTVSSKHAEIRFSFDRGFYVRCVSRTNKLWVQQPGEKRDTVVESGADGPTVMCGTTIILGKNVRLSVDDVIKKEPGQRPMRVTAETDSGGGKSRSHSEFKSPPDFPPQYGPNRVSKIAMSIGDSASENSVPKTIVTNRRSATAMTYSAPASGPSRRLPPDTKPPPSPPRLGRNGVPDFDVLHATLANRPVALPEKQMPLRPPGQPNPTPTHPHSHPHPPIERNSIRPALASLDVAPAPPPSFSQRLTDMGARRAGESEKSSASGTARSERTGLDSMPPIDEERENSPPDAETDPQKRISRIRTNFQRLLRPPPEGASCHKDEVATLSSLTISLITKFEGNKSDEVATLRLVEEAFRTALSLSKISRTNIFKKSKRRASIARYRKIKADLFASIQ